MSDYEGDWEPVSSHASTYRPTVPPQPEHNYIVPRGTSLFAAQEAARQKPRRPHHHKAAPLPPNYRPALQRILPRTPGPTGRPLSLPAKQQQQHVQAQATGLEAFTRYTSSKDHPDGTYSSMYSWEALVKSVVMANRETRIDRLEFAKDRLAEICISTNAFIAVPNPTENSFRIWGTPEQVSDAHASLRSWEMSLKGPGSSVLKSKYFAKQIALDGREEDRLLRKDTKSFQNQTFQYLADDMVFPFEAHLLWPEGYDLAGFINDYDKNTLQTLKALKNCNIVHNQQGVRATKVSCESQEQLFDVYTRLLSLVKEMVASKKSGVHTVYCRLPSFDGARQRVVVRKGDSHKRNTLDIPELQGPPLPVDERETWTQLSERANRRFQTGIKSALRSCIRSLHVSQKHVRMRFTFGQIGLSRYRPPVNEEDYGIEEFILMIPKTGVQTSQLPLLTGANFDFINKLDSMSELSEPEYSWTVHYDFKGANNGILRLVREFSYNPIDPEDPSRSATRWLHFNHDATRGDELLQLDHIDLEKVSYAIHIGATTIYQNSRATESLRLFENSCQGYRPSMNGLRFAPSKHAIYPPGNRELELVEEITSARYNLKQHKGTLEIRRKDIFPQRIGQASAAPERIEWQAHYYYQEWDNLMAQFANLDAGEGVDWKRDFKTFFPDVADTDHPKLLPDGFKQFMKELEEVQNILSRALGQLPDDLTDGMSPH